MNTHLEPFDGADVEPGASVQRMLRNAGGYFAWAVREDRECVAYSGRRHVSKANHPSRHSIADYLHTSDWKLRKAAGAVQERRVGDGGGS